MDFSIISHTLYPLLWNSKPWKWKREHKAVVKTEALKTYQLLGLVHPETLLQLNGVSLNTLLTVNCSKLAPVVHKDLYCKSSY